MAELSNDGSGLAAATPSARTRPYASLPPRSVGTSGRIVARMPARWSSTEVSGSPSTTLVWASVMRCLPLASWEAVQVLAQPGHDLLGQVGPLARELDQRAQVVQLVAGVVTAAVEQHAVHPASPRPARRGPGQQRVRGLGLPPPAGRGMPQHLVEPPV